MKIKTAIITAITAVSALTMNVGAAEKTAVTATAVTTASTVTETTAMTTQHIPTAGSIVIDKEKVESGEFYNEVMEYVGKDNAPNLNDNLKNNALAINKATIDYSDKSMYTITTRSGDVFYLIINSDDGSCLFLNSVDTADLTSLLSKGSSKNTMNENALEDIEKIELEQAVSETIPIDDAVMSETKTSVRHESSIFDNLWWMIGAGVFCLVVAVIVAIIKRRKGSNSGYDDLNDNNGQNGYKNAEHFDDEE